MAPVQLAPHRWLGEGKIIILNGFPGTGKLTIAKRMKSHFPEDTARLIDNHLLIDPAQAIYPGRNAAHHELRRRIREPIFNAIKNIAEQGKIVLMTACLVANDSDIITFKEYLSIVRDTPVPLYWITLQCDQRVLERRLVSKERQEGSKSKLVDIGILHQMIEDYELLIPRLDSNESAWLIAETLDVNGTLEDSVHQLLNKL